MDGGRVANRGAFGGSGGQFADVPASLKVRREFNVSSKRAVVVCPNGHRFRVKPRQLGKIMKCQLEGCGLHFTLRSVDESSTTQPEEDSERSAPEEAAAPETIEFEDLHRIFRRPDPARPHSPVLPAIAPRPLRRRPWFALAVLTLSVLFVFFVPIRTCPKCGGEGELRGRVLYRDWLVVREPVLVTPNRRCPRCSATGRLTVYQLLSDRAGPIGP